MAKSNFPTLIVFYFALLVFSKTTLRISCLLAFEKMHFVEALAFAGVSVNSVGDTISQLSLSGGPSVNRAEGAFPVLRVRNDTTTTTNGTTINMFIDDIFDGNAGYAASVISACADSTIYAIRCTSGLQVGTLTCGPSAPVSLASF